MILDHSTSSRDNMILIDKVSGKACMGILECTAKSIQK